MSIDAFSQYFSTLTDPRQSSKISYPLFDILFLAITSIIAGAEGWEDIEDFGETYLDWYQKNHFSRMEYRDMILSLDLFLVSILLSFSTVLSSGFKGLMNVLKGKLSPLTGKHCGELITARIGSRCSTW